MQKTNPKTTNEKKGKKKNESAADVAPEPKNVSIKKSRQSHLIIVTIYIVAIMLFITTS